MWEGRALRPHDGKRLQQHALVGATSNLLGRVQRHRDGKFDGSTKRYGIKRLIYEAGEEIDGAIAREKTIKKWPRDWKHIWLNGRIRSGMISLLGWVYRLPSTAARGLAVPGTSPG